MWGKLRQLSEMQNDVLMHHEGLKSKTPATHTCMHHLKKQFQRRHGAVHLVGFYIERWLYACLIRQYYSITKGLEYLIYKFSK